MKTIRLLPAILLAACSSLSYVAETPMVETTAPGQPPLARVQVVNIDDGEIQMKVFNESPYTITLNRDAVTLASAAGVQQRVPGGISSQYTIPPGQEHDLNVTFKMDNIAPGSRAEVRFDGAVLINGTQPASLAPIPLVAAQH